MDHSFFYDDSDYVELRRIIQYKHRIRKTVQEQMNKFISVQKDFLQSLYEQQLNTAIADDVQQKILSFFDTFEIQSLNEQATTSNVNLALVGENSSGKTTLLHYLLRSDKFLPCDVGSISARIIRLTYAKELDAKLCMYQSLNERNILQEVDLSRFFVESANVNWKEIRAAIEKYVMRPENIDVHSERFAEWAKVFVEIRIPSPFLKLGIDLYDTPGLLFSDPPILKENLHQLVELVRPTLIFTYVNPSITNDTRDCLLALKDALRQLTNTSLFFLNTKADIDPIIQDQNPDDEDLSDKQIREILLVARQKRYQFLLQAPSMSNQFADGLPKSLEYCTCFDIFSAYAQSDKFGAEMNQTTINRLVQFTANADLTTARKIVNLVLPVIDAVADFSRANSDRTNEKLQELRDEAYQWGDSYFSLYRRHIFELLNELYEIIFTQLDNEHQVIVHRLEKSKTPKLITKHLKSIVLEEIVMVYAKCMLNKHADLFVKDLLQNAFLMLNQSKNDIFSVAFRLCLPINIFETSFNDDSWIEKVFMLRAETIIITVIMSHLYEPDSWVLRKVQKLCDFILEADNQIEQPLRKEMTPLQISEQRLSEMRSRLVNLKIKTEPLVEMFLREQKDALKQSIELCYELVLILSPLRKEAYELVKKYAVDFARIECKLLASIDLAKFDGKTPIIEEFETAESIIIAKWGDENDLIAKKTCDCLMVHHHRALTRLLTSHIVPMLYLYENENNGEFWMLFKRFNKSLNDIHLTVENIVKIISEIGAALVELHEKNIAFQDFKAKNIYFDDKQVCYICNIGTKNVTPDHSAAIVDNINKFSQLGMCLLNKVLESVTGISKNDMEKLNRLKNILEECTNRKTKRLEFAALINELKQLK